MTGIRNSRRIVFWDTTLNQLSEKEILSVAAHEMGHYKLNHIRNSMVLGMGILLLSVFALNFIMIKLKGKNYRVIDNILVIIFISNLMTYIITPMENSYSRMIETQADEFAMEITEDPLTNGLLEVRFIESNLTPVDVKGFFKYMAYDHPTVKERIENSNRFVKNMSR
jgi:STE24 endopeptidase